MGTDIKQLRDHTFRLVYFVQNVACHRALRECMQDTPQNFWTLIFNNFLDFAVLEWCKIFGARSEPTHWTKLITDHDKFRDDLLKRVGLSVDEWKTYRDSIKDYRDNFVSHHQKNPNVTQYPKFDYALTATFYYYERLIKELRMLGITEYPDELQGYYDRCLSQAVKFSKIAYQSTIDIKETVY